MPFLKSAMDVLSGRRTVANVVGTAVHGYRTIRVAVMGSKASGKTVFLTALANHLRDHRPTDFPLGGKIVTWDKDAISGTELHGIPLFCYERTHGALANGEWPEKTVDSSMLALRLLVEDKNGKQENVQLEVVDVPGERIADFSMIGRSFKQWSQWMERESSTVGIKSYLDAVEKSSPENVNAVFGAYRDFVAAEFANYAPCITPSTLKLGIDGSKRAGGNPAVFRAAIEEIPVGFTDEKGKTWEFAPLPESCFNDDSPWRDTVKRFEKAYDRYVRKIVRPTTDWMAGAEKLYYLVDVLSLLKAGAAAYESERQYGEAAISALCPRGGSVLNRMGRWASGFLWKTRIRAVYVVATKADCVWSRVNRDNLATLADGLFGRATKFLDRTRVKTVMCLSCASVESTKERADGQPGLQGRIPESDAPDAPVTVQKWKPSDVPTVTPGSSEEWNAKIANGEFNYQFAFPWFDSAQICPPRHLGLSVLAEAMLDD